MRKNGGKVHERKASKALADIIKAKLALAKSIGFRGNGAILKANEMVRDETGIDCVETFNASHLKARPQHHPDEPGRFDKTLFKDFIDDECLLDPVAKVGATVLFEHCLKWIKSVGLDLEEPPTQNQFGSLARNMFRFEKRGNVIYHGVKLAPRSSD